MKARTLGKTGLSVSELGFGAFKIGRNHGIKYSKPYDLPDDYSVSRLLDGLLDLGITFFDTAPAYGLSEERIGRAIWHRREEFVLSTKVGETFENGRSTYDFSREAIVGSVQRSMNRLRTDTLDLVFLHSPGGDLRILNDTDAVQTLVDLRRGGLIRAIGLSGKTVEGARQSLEWADVLMVEYHSEDLSHAEVMGEAAAADVGVIVKKGLASGKLPAATALRFVLGNSHVASVVVGGLNLEHFRENIAAIAD